MFLPLNLNHHMEASGCHSGNHRKFRWSLQVQTRLQLSLQRGSFLVIPQPESAPIHPAPRGPVSFVLHTLCSSLVPVLLQMDC